MDHCLKSSWFSSQTAFTRILPEYDKTSPQNLAFQFPDKLNSWHECLWWLFTSTFTPLHFVNVVWDLCTTGSEPVKNLWKSCEIRCGWQQPCELGCELHITQFQNFLRYWHFCENRCEIEKHVKNAVKPIFHNLLNLTTMWKNLWIPAPLK